MVAGGKKQGVWEGRVYTVIFKMDNQQGPTESHRELCSMLCSIPDGRGIVENGYMCMYG